MCSHLEVGAKEQDVWGHGEHSQSTDCQDKLATVRFGDPCSPDWSKFICNFILFPLFHFSLKSSRGLHE